MIEVNFGFLLVQVVSFQVAVAVVSVVEEL